MNIEHSIPQNGTEHRMEIDTSPNPLPGRGGEGEPTSPETGRLSVQTVEHLHRLLGGDPRVEGMVLKFIEDKYGAKNLLQLQPHVAREVLRRPADLIRAAKRHCEPELGF